MFNKRRCNVRNCNYSHKFGEIKKRVDWIPMYLHYHPIFGCLLLNISCQLLYLLINLALISMTNKDIIEYINIVDNIESIYLKIRDEGTNPKMRYIVFWVVITILLALAGALIYLIHNGDKSSLNMYSYIAGGIALSVIVGMIIFIQREDNKKYRYHELELEESTWSFQVGTQKKYNQLIADKFDASLIENNLLSGLNHDIELISIYIQTMEKKIKRYYVEPMITEGRIPLLILFLTIGVQSIFFILTKYEADPNLMLAISILVLLVSGALFFLLYMIGNFYKDLKNQKTERLNKICDYLDAIRLKRIFEKIDSKRNISSPTLFQRIKNIFCCK